jgi:hypothetical protein
MKEYIEKVKACKTSSEMYSICEELAERMSDTQERLRDAEWDYDWDQIAGNVQTLAYWKYLHDYIYDLAEDLNEAEVHESDVAWDQEMEDLWRDEDRQQFGRGW